MKKILVFFSFLVVVALLSFSVFKFISKLRDEPNKLPPNDQIEEEQTPPKEDEEKPKPPEENEKEMTTDEILHYVFYFFGYEFNFSDNSEVDYPKEVIHFSKTYYNGGLTGEIILKNNKLIRFGKQFLTSNQINKNISFIFYLGQNFKSLPEIRVDIELNYNFVIPKVNRLTEEQVEFSAIPKSSFLMWFAVGESVGELDN